MVSEKSSFEFYRRVQNLKNNTEDNAHISTSALLFEIYFVTIDFFLTRNVPFDKTMHFGEISVKYAMIIPQKYIFRTDFGELSIGLFVLEERYTPSKMPDSSIERRQIHQ